MPAIGKRNLPVREEGRGDRPERRSRSLTRARAEPLAVEERPAASFWRKAPQWPAAHRGECLYRLLFARDVLARHGSVAQILSGIHLVKPA